MAFRLLSALVLTLSISLTAAAADVKIDGAAWRDTVRDVYVDGALDRPTQVLMAEGTRRLAVLSPRLDDAVIIDLEAKTSWRAPKRMFALTPDKLAATANVRPSRRLGSVTSTTEGVHSTRAGRHLIVVAPHQSTAGPIPLAALENDYPAWGAAAKMYTPRAAVREQLSTTAKPTTVKVVFATWCGDSKNYVPKLLGSISAANNPNLKVELTGIGPDFATPLDFVQEHRIINIPTFIVEQNGVEIGRITETPALPTVEEDLAAILTGTLPKHEGRWQREARIASGTYELEERGVPVGTEAWSLYSTPSGGRLLHSVISRGEAEREVWQTYDKNGRTTFVEVTERDGDASRRTRYRRGPTTLTATSRGSESGIVDQIIAIPDSCGFDAATAAGAASDCQATAPTELVTYRLSACDITGRLVRVGIRPSGQSTVTLGEERIEAQEYDRTSGDDGSRLLVATGLNIPVSISSASGFDAKLVELTRY